MNLPIVTDAENIVKKELSWIAHHLILVGVLVVVLFAGVYGVTAIIDKHDKERAQQANVAFQVVVDQVKRLEDHQTQNDAAVAQREAARDILIQTLAAAIKNRDAALMNKLKRMVRSPHYKSPLDSRNNTRPSRDKSLQVAIP